MKNLTSSVVSQASKEISQYGSKKIEGRKWKLMEIAYANLTNVAIKIKA